MSTKEETNLPKSTENEPEEINPGQIMLWPALVEQLGGFVHMFLPDLSLEDGRKILVKAQESIKPEGPEKNFYQVAMLEAVVNFCEAYKGYAALQ